MARRNAGVAGLSRKWAAWVVDRHTVRPNRSNWAIRPALCWSRTRGGTSGPSARRWRRAGRRACRAAYGRASGAAASIRRECWAVGSAARSLRSGRTVWTAACEKRRCRTIGPVLRGRWTRGRTGSTALRYRRTGRRTCRTANRARRAWRRASHLRRTSRTGICAAVDDRVAQRPGDRLRR